MSDGTVDLLMHPSSSSSPQHADYNSGLSLKTCESAPLSSKCACEKVKSSAAVLPPCAPFHNLHHQPSAAVHVNVNQLQWARARGVREETEGCSSVLGAATVKTIAPTLKSSSSCGSQPHQGIITRQPTSVRSSNSTPVFNEAQLTIFYSGIVNVYNDVPADTAEAIMVLADLNVRPDPFNSKAALNAGINLINTKSSALSPNISINIPDAKQRPRLIKRSHIELPYARTLSLVRFLEKRRERVQAKAGQGDAA